MHIRFLAIPALVSLAGCERLGAGPCYHDYRDPILSIRAVTDTATGRAISRIALTNIRVNGHNTPIITPPSNRVVAHGDTLWCDVSCGFGTDEGTWSFDVTAPGYRTRAMQISARYSRFDGGCPSSNSGSTTISLRLVAEAAN